MHGGQYQSDPVGWANQLLKSVQHPVNVDAARSFGGRSEAESRKRIFCTQNSWHTSMVLDARRLQIFHA
jgi:hypothetical protein